MGILAEDRMGGDRDREESNLALSFMILPWAKVGKNWGGASLGWGWRRGS